MSGFEIAGIVLGALPLFIEAYKSYADDINALHIAASRSAQDRKLQDFYEQFWWETFELRKHIQDIVSRLPGLSEERKIEIIDSRGVENWDNEPDIVRALQGFFKSEDDQKAFKKVMGKISGLLTKLVNDDTIHISTSDKIYQRLTILQADHAAERTSDSFWKRFRFLRREKDRDVCLRNLKTWNKRIPTLINAACSATKTTKVVTGTCRVPSPRLRTLSQKLFSNLSNSWSCECESPHKARFSLASCGNSKQDPDKNGIYFDFLLWYSHSQKTGKWYEATVIIKDTNVTKLDDRAKVKRICDAIQSAQGTDYCLQFFIEDFESTQEVWRLRSLEPQLNYLELDPVVSFDMMLQQRTKPPLIERRRLALVFAYSLYQLHESPWLSKQWAKDHIHFFHTSPDKLDLKRPYMSSSFDQFPSTGETPDLDRFHRNLGILKLGILLIEAHTWKPLESFRIKQDMKNGKPTPNTNMEVARRILNSLNDCSEAYKNAIEACLRTPWAGAGSRVNLEDPETWNGVYNNVIEPLEMEVSLGSVSDLHLTVKGN